MSKNGLIILQCKDFMQSYIKCIKEQNSMYDECYRLYNMYQLCKTMSGTKWISEIERT